MTTTADDSVQRYVPLVSWVAVLLACLLICFKIVGYGFLPPGDARRHAAKALTGKEYTEILVMRPGYTMDHSAGWDWVLRHLHTGLDWSEDALVVFSIAATLACIFAAPVFFFRRPEAWLAAILAEMIAVPELMTRFTQGRPYLLTESLLICVLLAWQKQSDSRPTPLKLALTGIAFAFSAWAHGAWYLWLLLPAAFFLAGRVRDSLYLTACWLGGSFLGACLTGKPFAYLGQALFIARSIQSEHVPARLLVGEFRPSEGEFATLTLLALVYLWRRQWKTPSLFRSPVVWMIFLGWMLGFKADRFWADWGVPSALVWLALQFDDFMANAWDASAPRRLAVCALIAAPLFLDSTADLGGRYSASVRETFLDSEDANLQGWMPSRGGIFYCADMAFFYNTFYKNPSGGWRYMVGFEPALMPEDDLKIYRNIQMNQRAGQAYEGWISKMRPEDRLAVQSAAKPTAPGLEWHEAGGGWWIARKNR